MLTIKYLSYQVLPILVYFLSLQTVPRFIISAKNMLVQQKHDFSSY